MKIFLKFQALTGTSHTNGKVSTKLVPPPTFVLQEARAPIHQTHTPTSSDIVRDKTVFLHCGNLILLMFILRRWLDKTSCCNCVTECMYALLTVLHYACVT